MRCREADGWIKSEAGDVALGRISLELLFKDLGGEDMCQERVLREGTKELTYKEGT